MSELEDPRPAAEAPRGGWRDRDHTRGSLLRSLVVLALPVMGTSAAMVVFQLFDLTFISRLGDAPMTSVIIVNQTLRQLVMMLIMGGSFGSQALIARAVGAGRTEDAEHIAGQVVVLGMGFALFVAVAGNLFPEFLFSLSGPDESFYAYGVPYLRLVFLLVFGMVGMQFFGAILGGAGDTTTPLLVVLVQLPTAILAEWVLIFGKFGFPALGVKGAALGVAVGQVVGLSVASMVLFGGRARVHLRRRHLTPDLAVMREIVRLSWPPGIQMAGQVAMTFAYLRLTGHFGDHVQTAYAVGLRLGMIVPMVCFPLAGACATLVGQALGSHNTGRAWRTVGVGLAVHGTVMAGFAAATFAFRSEIMGLFSDDPAVVEVGAEYLLFASGAFLLWAFYFVFLRSLQGAGDMVGPMVISLGTTLLVSIPLAFALALGTDLGRTGIWVAFLASSVVSTTLTGARLATGRWARRGAHSPGT